MTLVFVEQPLASPRSANDTATAKTGKGNGRLALGNTGNIRKAGNTGNKRKVGNTGYKVRI